MIVTSWNIRGLNKSLKQNGVMSLVRKHSIDIIGIMETKLNIEGESRLLKSIFGAWSVLNNFEAHEGGRILILWNPLKVLVELLSYTSQIRHTKVTCKISNSTFFVSFVYGMNTTLEKRPLWKSLVEFGRDLNESWMLLGISIMCCLPKKDKMVLRLDHMKFGISHIVVIGLV